MDIKLIVIFAIFLVFFIVTIFTTLKTIKYINHVKHNNTSVNKTILDTSFFRVSNVFFLSYIVSETNDHTKNVEVELSYNPVFLNNLKNYKKIIIKNLIFDVVDYKYNRESITVFLSSVKDVIYFTQLSAYHMIDDVFKSSYDSFVLHC